MELRRSVSTRTTTWEMVAGRVSLVGRCSPLAPGRGGLLASKLADIFKRLGSRSEGGSLAGSAHFWGAVNSGQGRPVGQDGPLDNFA